MGYNKILTVTNLKKLEEDYNLLVLVCMCKNNSESLDHLVLRYEVAREFRLTVFSGGFRNFSQDIS